jgi:hypothetical protein
MSSCARARHYTSKPPLKTTKKPAPFPRGRRDQILEILMRDDGAIKAERIISCVRVGGSEGGGIGLERLPVHQIGRAP